jgi:drug/metabolite transporter (DMT)-like permease
MWLAAFFVFIYLLVRKKLDFHFGKQFWEVILTGLVIAGHWVTFFHAIKISTVSVALVCISTGALFGSLIEPIFSKKKIAPVEIILGLIVALGIYIIFRFEGDYTLGIITALISAFLSALLSVLNARLVKTYRSNHLTFWEMLIGSAAIFIYMGFNGQLSLALFSLPVMDWVYLIILGSVCTAYAFIESVALMKHISPFTFLLAINLEPIYAIVLALLLFNEAEKLNSYFFVGAGIILSTVFLDSYLKRKTRLKNQKSSGSQFR